MTAPLVPVALEEVGDGAPPRPTMRLDPYQPFFSAHAHAIYRELVQEHPVAWSTTNGGFWMLTGYRPVYEATRDDGLFITSAGVGLPRDGEDSTLPPGTGPIPIEIDAPRAQQLRKAALGPLSPGAVAALEPVIRRMTGEFVDAFVETGRADLVQQLTTPLPARVTLHLLGLDESRWAEWVSWIHAIIHGSSAEGRAALGHVFTHVSAAIAERTANPRGSGDLLTAITRCQVDGRTITVEEQTRYVFLVLLGGMDTTSGLTGNALIHLGRDDALRQRLIDRRELLATATEEFLRIGTPTQCQMRILSRDVERWPDKHLAFGVGIHRCLGSNLARTMFRVMIDEILDRLPDFRILVTDVPRFDHACNVWAPTSLPVAFPPGPRTSTPARRSA